MKKLKNILLISSTSLAIAMLPGQAASEAVTVTGNGTIQAGVNLDFRINIPSVLRFRVGSPGGTINEIIFDPPAATLGDPLNPVSATSGGDTGTPGDVSVQIISNAGVITITESNNSGGAGLANLVGNRIPYAEIGTTSDNSDLSPPVLSNSGTNTSSPTINGSLTIENATWTYAYLNSAVYESGTYGTSARGGRVTYTASNP